MKKWFYLALICSLVMTAVAQEVPVPSEEDNLKVLLLGSQKEQLTKACQQEGAKENCLKEAQAKFEQWVLELQHKKVVAMCRAQGLNDFEINKVLKAQGLPQLEIVMAASGGWNFEDDLGQVHLQVYQLALQQWENLQMQSLAADASLEQKLLLLKKVFADAKDLRLQVYRGLETKYNVKLN